MNFNTLEFLLVFLPITLGVYYAVPARYRLIVLCFASSAFYGAVGPIPLLAMILTITWGALTGLLMKVYRNWATFLLAVFAPLFVLFAFKYLNFTLQTVRADESTRQSFSFFLSVILPPGISFYTFQILAYSFDVKDGRIEPEREFLKLYAYIALFPQLIAGPILRYDQMRDQLTRIATVEKIQPDWVYGLKFLSIGLFAKIFFADIIASLLGRFTPARNGPWLDAAFNLFGYSFQIYYDFWAYSLMAMGIARLLNLRLPINFAEPYCASNPQEFWRRWHITLSYWLRDYAYIKLGGNRAYVRNIIIVFLLCGLWHGAGWNFVVWGGYHAFLVLGYHLMKGHWEKLPKLVQISLTFLLVALGWPLFQFGFAGYVDLIVQLFSFEGLNGVFGAKHWTYLSFIALWTFSMRERVWLYNDTRCRIADTPIVHALLLMLAVLFFEFRTTFIYFQF